MKDLTAEEKQHFFNVWKDASLQVIEERPQGEWITNKIAFYWVCSACNAEVRSNMDEVYLEPHTLNFCPNCGADMRGEKE